MNSLMTPFLAFSLVLVGGSFAQAQGPADLPQCKAITQQCEAAGFKPGDHKVDGKGLWVDCVEAIAKGKTVAGVTSTAADAKACGEAAKAAHAAKKAARASKK